MITWQKVLLIILSISTYNTVMSMEVATEDIETQVLNILKYARDREPEPLYMVELGRWLTNQRNKISENNEWDLLITKLLTKTTEQNEFIEKLKGCHCGLAKHQTNEIIDIIRTFAQDLKPNVPCEKSLVNLAWELTQKNKRLLEYGPGY